MTKPTEEYTDDNPAPRRQRIVFRRNGPPKVLAEGESPLTVIEPPDPPPPPELPPPEFLAFIDKLTFLFKSLYFV